MTILKASFIAFIICCSVGAIQSQDLSGIVIYGQEFNFSDKSGVTKHHNFSEALDQDRKSMKKAAPYIRYQLTFRENEALFQTKKALSIGANNDVEETILGLDADGVRYYSFKEGITLWQHKDEDRSIIVIDSINVNAWKITSEQKTISGKKAIKAIIKKKLYKEKTINVVAWFSPEIPLPFGPKGYWGLPGLILELQEGNSIIFAKKIKFKNTVPAIRRPKKGVLMTRTTYEAYIEDAVKKMIADWHRRSRSHSN